MQRTRVGYKETALIARNLHGQIFDKRALIRIIVKTKNKS